MINKTFNKIALNNLSAIHLSISKESNNDELTSMRDINLFNLELNRFGYLLDQKAIFALLQTSSNHFSEVRLDVLSELSILTHSGIVAIPLFREFPCETETVESYYLRRLTSIVKQGHPNFFDRIFDYYNTLENNNNNNEKENAQEDLLECGHTIYSEEFDISKFGACPICQCTSDFFNIDFDTLNKDANKSKKIKALSPKFLTCVYDSDIYNLFKSLITSKTNISQKHKDIIKDIFKLKGSSIKGLLPKEISIKENAAFVSSLIVGMKNDKKYLLSYNKTATDILRFAVACSGGNTALSTDVVFKLNKKEAKLVMFLLDNIKDPLEDLKKYRSAWLTLSKIIHIGSYKDIFKNAFKNIQILRNEPKSIKSFNSIVEKHVEGIKQIENFLFKKNELDLSLNKSLKIKNNQILKEYINAIKYPDDILNSEYEKYNNACLDLAKLLKSRPGIFARRIDFVLKNTTLETQSEIFDIFMEIIDQIPNNILLNLNKLFLNRDILPCRIFFPKSSAINMKKGSKQTGTIYDATKLKFINATKEQLKSNFKDKKHFENVFIDKNISKIMVPFAMRSNSFSNKEMTRGSRIKFADDAKVIRFFTNWFDVVSDDSDDYYSRVDLDLSAVIYNDEFQMEKILSYYSYNNVKNSDSYFSGDVTSGESKQGGFEAIDIDIDKMLQRGRYVVMCLNSYTGQKFNQFQVVAGFMERDGINDGNVFEPKTIKNSFSLNGENKNSIPLIIDLKKREVIWLDIFNNGNHEANTYANNVSANSFSITEALKTFSDFNLYKHNMLELVHFHSERFEHIDYVKDPEKDYDLIIDEDFVGNIPEIMSNWM